MLAHFAVSEKGERAQATDFSRRFGCDLERVEQGVGVTGDYMVVCTGDHTTQLEIQLGYPILSRRVEFKYDHASLRTNNFFVEFEQTSNGWCTRSPSGHAKAISEGHVLVISSGLRTFVFNEDAFKRFVEGATQIRTTTFRKNGNHPESFTRGHIIPVKVAMKTACFIYTMPE